MLLDIVNMDLLCFLFCLKEAFIVFDGAGHLSQKLALFILDIFSIFFRFVSMISKTPMGVETLSNGIRAHIKLHLLNS